MAMLIAINGISMRLISIYLVQVASKIHFFNLRDNCILLSIPREGIKELQARKHREDSLENEASLSKPGEEEDESNTLFPRVFFCF